MVALRGDVLPSLYPICDMKHIVPAVSYMVFPIGELLTHLHYWQNFGQIFFGGGKCVSHVVLLAYSIKLNISTNNTVTKKF